MACTTQMVEPGFPMCLALKLLVNLGLTPEERATFETTQKSQRIWINLEAFVTSLVHRKRTARGGGENFTMTKAEAAAVAEYLKHVQGAAAQMLWLELGQEYIAATEDTLAGAMQDKAPVTPVLNPAESTSWLPGQAAPVLNPAGSVSWMPGQAAASTDGPLPGGNFPSAAAIAAKARMPIMPPGLEDLPTFDRKRICSALEIVIKGVEK